MKEKYRFDIKLMMADCEANYARICRLMPAVLQPAANANADPDTDSGTDSQLTIELATDQPASLSMHIRERSPFTTTVDIQVRVDTFAELEAASGSVNSGCINMAVRLYHDVNMAEVFACNRKPSRLARYEYPNDQMFQPDEKAQQNRFLSEWLGLCLRHGMAASTAIGDMGGASVNQDSVNQDNATEGNTDNNASASHTPLNLSRLLPSGNLAAGL